MIQDDKFTVNQGVDQYYYSMHSGRQYVAIDGSPTEPVITSGPTMKVSRYENMVGSQNGGVVNNEANAAIQSISVSDPSSTMQANAGYFSAVGQAVTPGVDALGLCAQGHAKDSAGCGIGLYAEGRNSSPLPGHGNIMAAEVRVTNLTMQNKHYSPGGSSSGMGVWATCDTDNNYGGANLCGVAFAAGGVTGSFWDVGFAVTQNSIASAGFRDDSNSGTVFAVSGFHQYGIDFSDATIVGPCLRTGQASVELTGNIYLDGVVSLDGLNSNLSDWGIGATTGNVFRVYSTIGLSIGGIAGGTNGRKIILLNTGANPITLTNSGESSQPSNRFAIRKNETLYPGGTVTLYYDGVNMRWRILSIY
ncbi:hypothetical protein [Robertmurraya sp.]|uniref:hypothetical protein n=1 Tax=Robertmurraya sp. TaxID=2837525 RepID=UPI003703DE74